MVDFQWFVSIDFTCLVITVFNFKRIALDSLVFSSLVGHRDYGSRPDAGKILDSLVLQLQNVSFPPLKEENVFGGENTRGRVNLMMLPDLGNLITKKNTKNKNLGCLIRKLAREIAMFVLFCINAFSYLKKHSHFCCY